MNKDKSVDVAVIGAGTAGLSAFKEASKVTKNILLIDHGPLGTTCARIGCMPSKTLIQAANYYHERNFYKERGIYGSEHISVNIPDMMKYLRKLRDHFTSGIIEYINSLGDKYINNSAEIDEQNIIKVANQKIFAKKIIIATGATSFVPNDWKNFSQQILTCENFFEQKDFADDMVVVGAGLIGLELGQALARLGIKINMFHSHDKIGKLTDPEVNKCAINIFKEEYNLYLNQKATLKKIDDQLAVVGRNNTIKTKQVLAALGRKPNLINIDFNKMGIKTDKAGIPLFDNTTMQISGSSLFLTGDVTKERQLLHEAADEGFIAGYNAVRDPECFRRRTPLSILFSDPNIAIIGQPYANLQERSDLIIGEVSFSNQGRARIMSENRGILRIYGEKNKGLLLGAEMIAPEGEHLAHLLAWAIQQNMRASDVLQFPIYHPVIEEGMKTALRDLAKKVTGAKKPEIPTCDSEIAPGLG